MCSPMCADDYEEGTTSCTESVIAMPHFGLVGPYRERCDEMVANGFEGFVFDANRQPAAVT